MLALSSNGPGRVLLLDFPHIAFLGVTIRPIFLFEILLGSVDGIQSRSKYMNQEIKYFIKSDYDGKKPLKEILEIWQSDLGWYWFVTLKRKNGMAYGFVKGLYDEWSEFYIPDLGRNYELIYDSNDKPSESQLPGLPRTSRVWKVPRDEWPYIPDVIKEWSSKEMK
jgi:hypothetical protein